MAISELHSIRDDVLFCLVRRVLCFASVEVWEGPIGIVVRFWDAACFFDVLFEFLRAFSCTAFCPAHCVEPSNGGLIIK